MKKLEFSIALISIIFLASCVSTPVTELGTPIPVKEVYEQNAADTCNMEFIGFKPEITLLSVTSEVSQNDSYLAELLGGDINASVTYLSDYNYWERVRDTSVIQDFPKTLSQLNYADDKTQLYFGDFTPQDLAVYNGSKRYVVFVSVGNTRFTYHDSSKTLKSWGSAGVILTVGCIAGCISMIDDYPPNTIGKQLEATVSVAGLGVGLLCFIPQLLTPKTKFAFKGNYAICVYDTQEKCLVAKEPMNVEWTDEWRGSIESDSTDMSIINEYCAMKVQNALLEGFKKLDIIKL